MGKMFFPGDTMPIRKVGIAAVFVQTVPMYSREVALMNSNRYLIALTTALGLVLVALDSTIVTIALTPIRTALNTDVNTVQWILTGYILANAAVVTIGGYLSNRFGRKRLFILGTAIFTIGSALCAVSPNVGWLIAYRILQGIGGGLLLPIGATLAFDAFPPEERAKASAVIAVPILLGPIFGPILGGYLNDTFGWHSIFLINVPIGLIAVVTAFTVLPLDKPDEIRTTRFDYLGPILSTAGIVAIVYALKLVTQTKNAAGDLYGWGYWLVWALISTGIVVLGIFAVHSLWISRDPALDLRQLKRRDFLVSNIFTWATALISLGLLVLLPLYLESVLSPPLSAQDTGLALVPFGLGAIVGVFVSTILYRAIGPRLVVLIASILSVLSAWILAQAIHQTANASQILAATRTPVPAVAGPVDLRWGMFLVGLGFAMVNVPLQTLALEALKGDALAKASSLLLSTKLIFQSIGVAVITTIFVDDAHSRATDLANQIRALVPGSGNVNPGTSPAFRVIEAQIVTQAGTWGVQSIFWLIFYASFGLIALSLLLPGRKRQVATTQSEGESQSEITASKQFQVAE
jgi:MFS transporter, DHA2 family, multidrug resistance protein